jgi:hypothetical protein
MKTKNLSTQIVLSIILLFIALQSCVKIPDYANPPVNSEISGTIMDSITNQPIANCRVNLFYYNGSAGMGIITSSKDIGTVATDANGHYQYNFAGDGFKFSDEYHLYVHDGEKYFSAYKEFDFSLIRGKINNKVDFKLIAK